jgi:hypothetical protein
MANFEAPVLYSAVTTTFKTAGFLAAGGTKRAQIYEVEMGQTGALASTDCQVQWDLSRGATVGLAATAVAANPLDTADYVASTLFYNAATAEFTPTTAGNGLSLKSWGINQRGSYRWRALDDGDNIIIPATGGVGAGLRAVSSNFTASAVGNISFIER